MGMQVKRLRRCENGGWWPLSLRKSAKLCRRILISVSYKIGECANVRIMLEIDAAYVIDSKTQ